MNFAQARVVHESVGNWTVDSIGDDGEVTDDFLADQEKVIEHAKQIMSELVN